MVHAIASLILTSQSQANLTTSATAPTETVLKRRLNEETTREIDEEVRAVSAFSCPSPAKQCRASRSSPTLTLTLTPP